MAWFPFSHVSTTCSPSRQLREPTGIIGMPPCPEVMDAGYKQIGGGHGIVDIDDARAMMWAS